MADTATDSTIYLGTGDDVVNAPDVMTNVTIALHGHDLNLEELDAVSITLGTGNDAVDGTVVSDSVITLGDGDDSFTDATNTDKSLIKGEGGKIPHYHRNFYLQHSLWWC